MAQSNTDYSAMVGSRICHDLISPVGAIGNGIELIGMSGESGPELDLITDSVGNANARIRFFRIAFGQSGAGQMVGANEVRSILLDLSAGARVQFLWKIARDVPRADLRALFQAMMCLESALPFGGEVSVHEADGDWIVEAVNQRVAVEDALWADLMRSTKRVEITPARVQFGLLPQTVASLGRDLRIRQSDDVLAIMF